MSAAPDLPGDLLALAREDLAAAEALDREERVSDAPVGFHAQQVVEKVLKALCQDADFELPADLDVRYGLGDPRSVAVQDALRWAALAVEWGTPSFARIPDLISSTCRRNLASGRRNVLPPADT